MSGKLTVQGIKNLKTPGKYSGGGGLGLILWVKASGGRFWVQRIVINGRRREIGLGGSTLRTYAYPVLGHLDVNTIKPRDVLRAVQPIWETKTETAKRLRGRIKAVLSWASVAGHRAGDNPARWRATGGSILAR